jgi:hemoglobin/transferrin/lactoferrin receptor protein
MRLNIAWACCLLSCLLFNQTILAQQNKDSINQNNETVELNGVTVYANKFAERSGRIAQTVKSIRDKNTLNMQPNTGDILINTGTLFVQKSQQGGSSPVIRGFEASRVLLTVDGIRMNNAVYRAGHLQNIITIDNMILDRMEVLYGPSSTLYGSDALGGVVSMFTRNPKLSDNGKTTISGSSTLRYASAIDEKRGNIILNIGGTKWASLTSVTYGSFGDMVQGKNRSSKYPNFGLKPFIVQRNGNTDISVPNPDPNKQTASGYKQVDVLQKFLYKPSDKIEHVLNFQFSNTSDLPRYDRLSEGTLAAPVYAEWYYGPQLRNLVSYHFNATKLNGFFQDLKLSTSFQDIEESRITRRFNNNNKDYRWERINVFGFNFDAKHYSNKHELHVGAESYTNFVRSTAERRNIVSGALSRITTRYADGPTKMSSNAVYAQHTYKINDEWTLNDGIRFNLVQMDARFADTTLMHFPFNRAQQNNVAVTGNIGVVYATQDNFRMALVFSSGFRAPNVDDLSKVFDTRTGVVVVPNTAIKPEYTYNGELSIAKQTKAFTLGGSFFYTIFRNALVLDKYKFNGQDSIFYSGVKSAVFANQNKASAYVTGFSLNGSLSIAKGTALDAVVTYTYGRYTDQNKVKIPLDHIPPVYGKMGIKTQQNKWNAEFYALFNGWKKLKDYNPNGEDNLQYATADGMPSWLTLNLRTGFSFSKQLQAVLVLENIADRNYRYFASGISAPGRNVSISLKASF